MQVVVSPTTGEETSPSVTVPPGGHVLFALHGVNLNHFSSGHKIQVLVGGTWHDHISWSATEPTIIVYGSTESAITVRAFKAATATPVGIRSA